MFTNINDFPLLAQTLPLPDAGGFGRGAFVTAAPQIFAYSSALIGVALTVLLVKSLRG